MLPSFEGTFERDAMIAAADILVKLGIAVVLGGLIGYERELHGRPAGVRTHMLMCLGVTLICEVSRSFAPGADASRIASNIVTGVGFLGAGSILRMGIEVRGLTTAASIWSAAAIGMAVSIGHSFYVVAVVATFLVLLTLSVVDRIEDKLIPNGHGRDLVVTAIDNECAARLLERLTAAGLHVSGMDMQRSERGNLLIRTRVRGVGGDAVRAAMEVEGVSSASWAD